MGSYRHLTTNELSFQSVWAWARRLVDDLNAADNPEVPAGTVALSAGSATPQGWLLCDGTSYAVNDYRRLFVAIGYTYGGSSANFLVPNLSPVSGIGYIIKA